MKYVSALIVSLFLVGCSSAPPAPKVVEVPVQRTVPYDDYQREMELYKRHIQQQDALMDKLSSRLGEMQTIIERNVRQQKNNECKLLCF